MPQLFRALSSQEYTTELTQTLQQAAPRPQSTEEEERKKHILSLRNLLAAMLILLAILTLLIVWGLVNQGLHTAKPAESTPASEPASSLVTEPVNLAPELCGDGLRFAGAQQQQLCRGLPVLCDHGIQ